MRVRMLYSRWGSGDGFVVRYFREGHEYVLSDLLARYFIRSKWAVECGGDAYLDPTFYLEPVASPFSFRF